MLSCLSEKGPFGPFGPERFFLAENHLQQPLRGLFFLPTPHVIKAVAVKSKRCENKGD